MKITMRELKEVIKDTIVEAGGSRLIQGAELRRGMFVAASYNSYNKGTDYVEILGVSGTDDLYGNGGVKFDSVEDAMKDAGVSSLQALEWADDSLGEYGRAHYLWVRDVVSGDSGPWYYLFKGKWARGSGAERLTFKLLSSEDEAVKLSQRPPRRRRRVEKF